MELVRQLVERHRRLKEKIHSTRIPLSPAGQRVAALVYMSLPLIGGFYIMTWAMAKSETKWGVSPDGRYVVPEAVRARGSVPNRELTAAEHRQVIAAIEKAVSPR
jgi:hypothetical protein